MLMQWAEERLALAQSLLGLLELHVTQANKDITAFDSELQVSHNLLVSACYMCQASWIAVQTVSCQSGQDAFYIASGMYSQFCACMAHGDLHGSLANAMQCMWLMGSLHEGAHADGLQT